MEIVKASFLDLEYVLPLVLDYYENDRPDVEMTDDEITQLVVQMLDADNCNIYAAVKGHEVIGVVGLNVSFYLGKKHAQEVFWKVKDEHTKTKAGSRLLDALEQGAREMEVDALTVIAMHGDHEKRLGNSYVSRGFSPVCSTYMKKLG